MRRYLPLTCIALLSACATPQYNYAPEKIEISEPPIGAVNIAYVGDEMLKQGKYTEYDAIKVPIETKAKAFTIMPGYYVKQGQDDKSTYYTTYDGKDSGSFVSGFLAGSEKATNIRINNDDNKLCVITNIKIVYCSKNGRFTKELKPILTTDSFQQTLIYSGRVGNKINVGYREFSNSLARPAFNNDVEYDLNVSMEIGYKGSQIEIIEATNQLIKYKVLRNFNDAK